MSRTKIMNQKIIQISEKDLENLSVAQLRAMLIQSNREEMKIKDDYNVLLRRFRESCEMNNHLCDEISKMNCSRSVP